MGNKINDTTNYPAVAPEGSDRVLLIDVSDTSEDTNGAVKTALVSSLVDGSSYATAAQGAKADTAVQPAAIADFEDTTALNARDTANRSRANHTGSQAQSTITDLVTDLAAKAPLASPAFTGNPTAPTQTASDNSTKIATTAYVDAAAGGGGGLVPISKTTAISDAAVDIDLTGGYSAYLIRINRMEVATDGAYFYMRTSTDGGTSFDSGPGNYGYNYYRLVPTDGNTNSNSATEIRCGQGIGNAAGEYLEAYIWVFPADGTRQTRILSQLVFDEAPGNVAGSWAVGVRKDTTAVDAVRIYMHSGNIDSGDFHLYGVADGA